MQQENLRDVYLQALLMVTLLVIFAFSSIGLRLARRVTEPIQALADGTRRISQGDLDHRVEVAVDDELRILVDGFNSMTEELKRSRGLVDRQYRELQTSNKRLQAVLQNVAAGVIAISPDERILTCNGAALDILAQREEDVLGQELSEAWADGERAKLRELLSEEFTWGGQIHRQMQMVIGGVWKTLEVKVTTLPDPEGRPGGRVMVLEDLTELIQAQKMATWNEVARRIAHEIKNPLTPIQLTAERLLRRHQVNDPRLGETLEQGVEVIVREVDSLKTMVDEFSRFARMPPPRPKDVDLGKLLGETGEPAPGPQARRRRQRPGCQRGAHRPLRSRAAQGRPHQPHRQRHGGHRRTRRDRPLVGPRRRSHPAVGGRYRSRDQRRRQGTDLPALLLHEGSRVWAGAFDCAPHRQ